MSIQKLTLLYCDEPKCSHSFGGPSGGEGNVDPVALKQESIDLGWFALQTEWGDAYFHSLACLGKWIRAHGKEPWEFFYKQKEENA